MQVSAEQARPRGTKPPGPAASNADPHDELRRQRRQRRLRVQRGPVDIVRPRLDGPASDQRASISSPNVAAKAPRKSRPWIVALGGHELNAGLRSVAHRNGAGLLVVDWNAAPAVSGDLHLRLDIKDATRVVTEVRARVEQLLFAYTSSDAGTETVAQINAAHGLERPDRRALETARNKLSMNEIWRREGLLKKRWRVCPDLDELADFHRAVGDVIVKPVGGSSSRGVTMVAASDDHAVLASAWHGARRIGRVMVEEYVRGIEFTVELIGDVVGNVQVLGISRKHPSTNAGRSRVAAKLHYNPPDVPRHVQLKIAEFGRRCFRSVGLNACLGHLELIMRTDGELVPLELGARSSGFVATHLVDAAAGEGGVLLNTYERVLRGARVANGILTPRCSSMYFFYDLPSGVGRRSGTCLMDFLPPGISSLAHNRSKLVSGMPFLQIDNESERHGYEILVGDSDALTIDVVEHAEAAFLREFLEEQSTHAKSLRAATFAGA